MARIRSVKPELCTSETMAKVSAEAERTYIRLWTHCDDEGRCKDHPKLLKATLFPLHDDVSAEDVERHLTELETHGLIVRYTVGGTAFLAVPSWSEHQHPQRPHKSKIPGPDKADDLPNPDGSGTSTRTVREPSGPVVEGSGVVEVVVEGDVATYTTSLLTSVEPDTPAVVVDEQTIRKTAALVARTIQVPTGADPAAYAAGVTRRILTGDDPTDRERIEQLLTQGMTPEAIAASWSWAGASATTEEVRERAKARERETQERLAEMTAARVDPSQGLAQVRSLREVRHG